jgi:hypothetical protein
MRVPRRARNWLLDGPARLVAVGTAVLVVVFVATAVVHTHGSRPTPAPITAPPSASSSTASTIPPTTTMTTVPMVPRVMSTPDTVPLPAAASAAATRFVTTWASQEKSAVWHRRIATMVDARERPGMAVATPPVGVRVTGAAAGSVDRGGGQVQVPTNRGPISMILVATSGQHWLVDNFSINGGQP